MNRQHTQSQPNLCAREEIAQHKRLMRVERRSDLDLLRFEKPKKRGDTYRPAAQQRSGAALGDALLDSITHDLCTPLTAIRAVATLLMTEHGLTKEQTADMYAVMDEESVRLDRLIRQIIETARMDCTSIQIHLQPQSLRELIDLILEESRVWMRQHKVSILIPDTLPLLPMDRELVRRVLRHLLENAARYSPPGSLISIAGRIEDDRLLVTVVDEGPGIDAAEQPFIFERYFRGRNRNRQVQGTGMGLAIAKAMIEAHRGGIGVASSPGHGAEFTFWIPL
jgi:two-component system sensor histidine kinase KdpD